MKLLVKSMKIPGIIGGLGPETTARIYLALAMSFAEEYPGILISNASFPKYIEQKIIQESKDCALILPYIIKSIKQLENAGADFIVLPCNTLHSLLNTVKKETHLEIIDLVEEVSKIAKNYRKVGIIASSKTVEDRLYENKNFEVVYPEKQEQKMISEIMVRIIRKNSDKNDKKFITSMINNLKQKGAEKIIFACTDISNLRIKDKDIIDSQKVLIDAVRRKMILKS